MFGMMFGQTELTSRVYEFTANHDEIINIADIVGEDFDIYFLEIMDVEFGSLNGGADHPSVTLQASVGNASPYDQQRVSINLYHREAPTYLSSGYYPAKQIFTTNELKIENGNGIIHDPMSFKIIVTAEFPQEDTGYIEEGFDYCLDVGANLVASPCRDEMDILDTLPSEIADNLNGIIGQGVASTNLNGVWVGSLTGLGGGNGYWFQSNVNACFNYNCAEN